MKISFNWKNGSSETLSGLDSFIFSGYQDNADTGIFIFSEDVDTTAYKTRIAPGESANGEYAVNIVDINKPLELQITRGASNINAPAIVHTMQINILTQYE